MLKDLMRPAYTIYLGVIRCYKFCRSSLDSSALPIHPFPVSPPKFISRKIFKNVSLTIGRPLFGRKVSGACAKNIRIEVVTSVGYIQNVGFTETCSKYTDMCIALITSTHIQMNICMQCNAVGPSYSNLRPHPLKITSVGGDEFLIGN